MTNIVNRVVYLILYSTYLIVYTRYLGNSPLSFDTRPLPMTLHGFTYSTYTVTLF